MSVIPELAYIQKSSCELLFFAAPPIESPLNFYRGISITAQCEVPKTPGEEDGQAFGMKYYFPYKSKFSKISLINPLKQSN